MHNYFQEITNSNKWESELKFILESSDLGSEYINEFHTHWIVKAHRIREQINNDTLLLEVLKRIFPKYAREPIELYRGENIDRYNLNQIGFCWTESIKVAEMFATGINKVGQGGVLISNIFQKDALIAPPNDHSSYLGEFEYIVDISKLVNTKTIQEFRN